MKKMNYGSYVCEVTVAANYVLKTSGNYEYDKDTVAYAIERFFSRCQKFLRTCIFESCQIRLSKGKARKNKKFTYLVPAVLMELPGNWIRMSGEITPIGVCVKKAELLEEHPCFE